ncbi:MAG TPA: endonuclease V [Marmoricola sp.]|nr:endonuclease V [Marmoricola sp.]
MPGGLSDWPVGPEALAIEQERVAALVDEPWRPGREVSVGGCWVCFPRGATGPGAAGDAAWTAAVELRGGRVVDRVVREGRAGAPYLPGLLALRTGRLLEEAVGSLGTPPDVLLVDATGRDHPRRAGLARHLGAVLDVPTVGVTHRPLAARGEWPPDERGASTPLLLDGEVVGCWLRTRPGTRPLAVHPGWRTTVETATRVVLGSTGQRRTPEPLRRARQLARRARGGQPPASR